MKTITAAFVRSNWFGLLQDKEKLWKKLMLASLLLWGVTATQAVFASCATGNVSNWYSTSELGSTCTLTIQPDAAHSDSALLQYRLNAPATEDTNYGNHILFGAQAWTAGGQDYDMRSLLSFRLDDIAGLPNDITTADLSLYGRDDCSANWPSCKHGAGYSQYYSVSTVDLRGVADAWDEDTVTWNNQPSTNRSTGRVGLNAPTSATQNYLNINVKTIVEKILLAGDNGFLLKMNPEYTYRSMAFFSPAASNPADRPKLVITYPAEQPLTCTDHDAVPDAWFTGEYVTNPFVSSYVTTNKRNSLDHCVSSNYLREYSCDGAALKTETLYCGGGCSFGKCIQIMDTQEIPSLLLHSDGKDDGIFLGDPAFRKANKSYAINPDSNEGTVDSCYQGGQRVSSCQGVDCLVYSAVGVCDENNNFCQLSNSLSPSALHLHTCPSNQCIDGACVSF